MLLPGYLPQSLPLLLPLKEKPAETFSGSGLCVFNGGELGIRTPGPVTVNSFQDCRNRPLCQLSAAKVRVQIFKNKKLLIIVHIFLGIIFSVSA